MKVETRIVLRADEGKYLTDGETYGKVIMLGESRRAEEFHEITEEEYNELINEDPENIATDEDYQNALRDMGVEL